jgi:hypothetical protein
MVIIGFGQGKGLLSWVVRKVTKGEWSHVFIEWWSDEWGGFFVTHAQSTGVVTQPLEAIREKYPVQKWYRVRSDEFIRGGLKKMRPHIGKPYDYVAVLINTVLLLLYYLFRWEWLWKIVWRDSRKFTCSEFVIMVLKEAAILGAGQLDPELTTPSQLERFCSQSECFIKL